MTAAHAEPGRAALGAALVAAIARRVEGAGLPPAREGSWAAALQSGLSLRVCFVDLLGASYTGVAAAAAATKGELATHLKLTLALEPSAGGPHVRDPRFYIASRRDLHLTARTSLQGLSSAASLLLAETVVPSGVGMVALSDCIPRYEAWRAAGPESNAARGNRD